MIIVIEGVDGSGKTTLANAFVNKGWRYVHNGPPAPDENLFDTYTEQILAVKPDENVVFDRLHVGEQAYGPVLRGSSRITLEQLRLLNRLLYSRSCLTIHCAIDPKQAIATWSSRRGQEHVQQLNDIKLVMMRYNHLFKTEYGGLNWTSYDYNSAHNYPASAALGLGEIAPLYRTAPLPDGVLGHATARFLITGERPGGERDLAFYSDKKSSHFLNEALWDAGFKEYELAFTNAYDINGNPRDLQKINEGRIVIALGALAQKACFEQGVPYLPVQHPQHVKRFHLPQRSRYVKQFANLRGNR